MVCLVILFNTTYMYYFIVKVAYIMLLHLDILYKAIFNVHSSVMRVTEFTIYLREDFDIDCSKWIAVLGYMNSNRETVLGTCGSNRGSSIWIKTGNNIQYLIFYFFSIFNL